MSFENYTDCVLRAFLSHNKPNEIIKRKHEIITSVGHFYNFHPSSILYVGFNPAILADTSENISITNFSAEGEQLLTEYGINYNVIPYDKLTQYKKQFEVVVAMDEYFTFAKTDTEQKTKVEKICNLASEYVITTCKDYKNQDFKDREFSTPALIRQNNANIVYLEFHDHDLADRNSWKTEVYEIVNQKLTSFGPYERKAMFFKQLAKFSADAGSFGFTVHKNLMYKSLIKKNYEHVISIQLENGS
jgi:hypothetical protein